jgi:hypothetical protein
MDSMDKENLKGEPLVTIVLGVGILCALVWLIASAVVCLLGGLTPMQVFIGDALAILVIVLLVHGVKLLRKVM